MAGLPEGKSEPDVTYEREGSWLLVRCSGIGSSAWLIALFRSLAQRVTSEPADAVLIDVSAVELPTTLSERYRLGEATAEWTGPPVAMVAAAQYVDPERFGEMVARNRGLDGRIFTDAAEAREWLRDRVAKRAT